MHDFADKYAAVRNVCFRIHWRVKMMKRTNNTKHYYKTKKENTKLAKFQGMEDIL